MHQKRQQLGIDRLSVDERIALISQVWESIGDSDLEATLPGTHRLELERRIAAADTNPGAGIPWQDFKAKLVDRS